MPFVFDSIPSLLPAVPVPHCGEICCKSVGDNTSQKIPMHTSIHRRDAGDLPEVM